jgi:hypothetical protein
VTVPQTYTVIVLAILGATFCAWQWRRAVLDTRADDPATKARTGLVLDDHTPGINTGWQDQCELIYSLPAADRTTSHEQREGDS